MSHYGTSAGHLQLRLYVGPKIPGKLLSISSRPLDVRQTTVGLTSDVVERIRDVHLAQANLCAKGRKEVVLFNLIFSSHFRLGFDDAPGIPIKTKERLLNP